MPPLQIYSQNLTCENNFCKKCNLFSEVSQTSPIYLQQTDARQFQTQQTLVTIRSMRLAFVFGLVTVRFNQRYIAAL